MKPAPFPCLHGEYLILANFEDWTTFNGFYLHIFYVSLGVYHKAVSYAYAKNNTEFLMAKYMFFKSVKRRRTLCFDTCMIDFKTNHFKRVGVADMIHAGNGRC